MPDAWTPDRIKAKLEASDVMVERALLQLWHRQTEDERMVRATTESNGVGFSGIDADILSSFAEQVQNNPRRYPEGQRLSPKQRPIARRKLLKYVRQIARIANGEV